MMKIAVSDKTNINRCPNAKIINNQLPEQRYIITYRAQINVSYCEGKWLT